MSDEDLDREIDLHLPNTTTSFRLRGKGSCICGALHRKEHGLNSCMPFKSSILRVLWTSLSCSPYFALTAYLYHNMSHQSSTIAALKDSSVHSYALLTPPLSPASSEDIPFKPEHGDHTSLSMKTRHRGKHHRRQRRLRNRACQSSHDLRLTLPADEVTEHPLDHSKSLPILKHVQLQPSPKTQSASQTQQRRSSRSKKSKMDTAFQSTSYTRCCEYDDCRDKASEAKETRGIRQFESGHDHAPQSHDNEERVSKDVSDFLSRTPHSNAVDLDCSPRS